MQSQFNNFVTVVRNAVHQKKKENLPENVDWEEVMHLAGLHKILPLCVEEAREYDSFLKSDVFPVCTQKALNIIAAQIRRTADFEEIYNVMRSKNVFPLVMKGVVCRQLYGKHADHRPSGDEDILIRKSDFEKTDEILKSEGFFSDFDEVTEKQKDFLQEVTYTSPKRGLRIEVHFTPLGTEDNLRCSMNSFFSHVHEEYREICQGVTTLRTMTHTDHFLFLIFHALKHLTVTGFGIRMLCDILLYFEKYEQEIDFEYIYEALEKVCAVSFFEDLVYIGNEHLGFDLPVRGSGNCPEILFDDILKSGIYGNFNQARKTSAHLVHMAFSKRKASSKFGKAGLVFDTVFPKKEKFRESCPEIDEKPWLIFGEYFKRIGRFLVHSKENKHNLAAESMKIGSGRIELLKKYGLL